MTNNYDFGDFAGTDTGLPVEDKWAYPGIGYNATDGVFYVDSVQVNQLEIVPFAIRECVEVTTLSGTVHRYPPRTPRNQRVEGELSTRLQMVCKVNEQLYIFGMRSYTARASFMNPAKGAWHNESLEEGIWLRLIHHINDVKVQTGKIVPPFCWVVSLTVGKMVKMVSGANSKQSTNACPIVMTGEFSFVGAEQANENVKLYQDEDLDGWKAEWMKISTEEAPAPAEEEVIALANDEDIPF